MLLLISGASGMGKSTVRERLASSLRTSIDAVELRDLGPVEDVTVAWRQRMAEVAVRRAAAVAPSAGHVLLSGDPVAAGEVVAAPSAVDVGGIAVCLLDADPRSQAERLTRRGDPADLLPLHLGFAQWMRDHAADPIDRLEVLTDGAAKGMRWERLAAAHDRPARWHMRVIDTSAMTVDHVADAVHEWIEEALREDSLVMHPEAWLAEE